MKVMKVEIFKDEEEARKLGKQLKIYDGKKWFIGIIWKSYDMVNKRGIKCIRLMEGE